MSTPPDLIAKDATKALEKAERGHELGRRPDGTPRSWWSRTAARVVLIALSLLFLLPIYWMIVSSLKTDEELAQFPPTLFPQSWEFGNFADAVTAMPFLQFFANSVIITVSVVVLSVLSNFVVAYGFACIDWPGRNKVFYLVIATLFLPFPVTLIPMFDLWARLGLVNTLFPLIIPAAFGSAFFTFLLRQFLLQIPKDMINAARIDGAGEWRILWTVVFPSCKPALGTVAIFAAVAAWNDFMGPLIYLNDPQKYPVALGMKLFIDQDTLADYGGMIAMSVLALLPVLLFFLAFQRFLVESMANSGIKG